MNVRLLIALLVFLLGGANSFAGTDLNVTIARTSFHLQQSDSPACNIPGFLAISPEKQADQQEFSVLICEDVAEEDEHDTTEGKLKIILSSYSIQPYLWVVSVAFNSSLRTDNICQALTPRYILHRNLRI